MMNVLITDANQQRCCTVARSLAEKGIKVAIAGEEGMKNVAFYSKYPSDRFLYPSPCEKKLFIRTIAKIARDYQVLIPLHERTIVPLSKHLDFFRKITKIPVPHYSILQVALDKAKTVKIAQSINVPTPCTYFINSLDEIRSISRNLKFPVIIKLRKEILTPPPRYIYAYSQKDFIKKYLFMHKKCKYPLVQEIIPGTGYGFFTLFNEKTDPVAIFCHKRIREFPITGGPSAYCESVYEPKIINFGLKILKKILWYGVAMVEFRLDSRDGVFKLMEINPRFWGSLPLAIASGVDFPYLLYRMAMGESIKCTTYKVGVKCRFLSRDCLALRQALRETDNKIFYVKSFFKSFFDKNIIYGDASFNDLMPMIYILLNNYQRMFI